MSKVKPIKEISETHLATLYRTKVAGAPKKQRKRRATLASPKRRHRTYRLAIQPIERTLKLALGDGYRIAQYVGGTLSELYYDILVSIMDYQRQVIAITRKNRRATKDFLADSSPIWAQNFPILKRSLHPLPTVTGKSEAIKRGTIKSVFNSYGLSITAGGVEFLTQLFTALTTKLGAYLKESVRERKKKTITMQDIRRVLSQ